MFEEWSDKPNPHLVEGIHPNELTHYMHLNKKYLEDFEKKFGNVLTYRSIWTKATNLRTYMLENILGKDMIPEDQEDHIRIVLDQLLHMIWINLNMTTKVNDDVVRHLTSLLFWEQEFGFGKVNVMKDPEDDCWLVEDVDNNSLLKDAFSRYSKYICKELKLDNEHDPKLKEYIKAVQSVYPTFKELGEKRKDFRWRLDVDAIEEEIEKFDRSYGAKEG